MSKKKHRRHWKAKVQAVPAIPEWQVVVAELRKGTASVGIRFGKENTVHFFELHRTPQEAIQTVAKIAKGEMTLKDIAGYDWHAVDMPHDYMENIDKQKGEP